MYSSPALRRVGVLTLAVTTGAAVVLAAGGAIADAAPTKGGTSTIAITSGVAKTLRSAKIKITDTGAATYRKSTFTFPNKSGTANAGNYVIKYSGGINFTRKGNSVVLKGLVYNSAKHAIYGTIGGRKSTQIFVTGDPMGGRGDAHFAQFGPYTVTWTKAAAKTINRELGTSSFTKHRSFGDGGTLVRY